MPDALDIHGAATERTVSARTRAGQMAVVPGIGALEAGDGPLFVVVGVFDGLHLGHAYLLQELRRAARRSDARAAVVTFDHHPDEILVGPRHRSCAMPTSGCASSRLQAST